MLHFQCKLKPDSVYLYSGFRGSSVRAYVVDGPRLQVGMTSPQAVLSLVMDSSLLKYARANR